MAVLAIMAVAAIALIIAGVVRKILPAGIEQFSGIIFWGVVIVIGALGSLIAGRFLNR